MLVKNGLIQDIGQNIKVPKAAVQVDLNGLYIYPSFIDAYTEYGQPEIKPLKMVHGPKIESGKHGAFSWNEAIHPEISSAMSFRYNKKQSEELRKLGYKITIYDRYDRPGGLLIYGIPNFKLEKFVVERRTNLLKKSGIKFKLNIEIGKDISLDSLKQKHDALLIATGVYKPREINLPGNNLKNIFPAMKFLTASNRKGLGDKVEEFENGLLNAENKNVIIIGGGDTAMDCVRTAIRQNAKSVKCLYRRDRENMPGSAREVYNAEEEGVKFIWLSNPKKFIGKNKISSVLVEKIKLGKPDFSGRKKPEIIPNSHFELKTDMAIKALGFNPEDLPKLFKSQNLLVSEWGTIKINYQTMETNIPGIFSAGDVVRGASLVVWAIRDGRDAALSINKYLELKRKNKIKAA